VTVRHHQDQSKKKPLHRRQSKQEYDKNADTGVKKETGCKSEQDAKDES
jgi:hypothetical protein